MRSAQGKPHEAESGSHGDRDHAAWKGPPSICKSSSEPARPAARSHLGPSKTRCQPQSGRRYEPRRHKRTRMMCLLSGQPMVLMVWRVELLPRRWVPGVLPGGEPLP